MAYCAACPSRCADCPRVLHRPESYEGVLFAELIPRLETQLRVIAGGDGLLVLGVDLPAVLALAGATGLPPATVANWLPGVEAAVVQALNRWRRDAAS